MKTQLTVHNFVDMQILYVFTAFPHVHNKWCLHGVGRVVLLTTCLYNASIWCKKSNYFYQSKKSKKQALTAKLINSSFLPTFTTKSFPPMVITLLFVQQQLLHRKSRRHCSLASVSRWWDEPISDPWGWTHTKGLWAGMFDCLSRARREIRFSFSNDHKKVTNNTGQTKEVLLCSNMIIQFSSFTVCLNTSALPLQ